MHGARHPWLHLCIPVVRSHAFVQGAGLRPALLRVSVRDVLLRGSFERSGGDGGCAGVLCMGACFLEGPQEDAALYLRGRYAASVQAAARGTAPTVAAAPAEA